MNLPTSILNPDAFRRSQAAGFDGVFDWSWTDGCFGQESKIKPMDFDGVVERNGQFIVFETKDEGKAIPLGQFRTLLAAHKLGCFTIMLIEGKRKVVRGRIWHPGAKIDAKNLGQKFTGVESAQGLVRSWYLNADTGVPF